ncbi:MAG: hypothetical protein V3U60_13080, partial [Gammaproteobacteria bacterium]
MAARRDDAGSTGGLALTYAFPAALPPPRYLPLPEAPAAGAASACVPCGWRVAAGFPCGGGSLAPRRSKKAPKTGDHGGIIRQPQRNRSIPKASAIPHALGEGHRALRAPASALMLYADSQAPGTKSGGSLRLLR